MRTVLLLTAVFLVATTTLLYEYSAGHTESVPADQPYQIKGQLVMLSRDVIVVLSPGGTNTIIPLTRGVHIDHALKEGEHVMVSISSNRAVAIRRAAP